jgi:DNA-binding transcriptional ArsR family regulator
MVKSLPAKGEHLDKVFHALADPTRRAILKRLTTKEQPVTEVARPFRMSLPAVSKHIKVLEGARLVRRTREGSYWYIRLDAAAMKHADQWLEDYRQFWEQSLDRLEEYLKNENKEAKKEKGR